MRRRGPLLLAAAAAVLAPPRPAAADDKHDCIAAAEAGQNERLDQKLRASLGHLQVCARDVCPKVVRDDCVKWLPQVQASIPTLVPSARDASGAALADVRVSIDGAAAGTAGDGRPREVDPGSHTVRFERAGSPPVDQSVTVAAGDKDRAVAAVLALPAPDHPAPAPAAPKRAIPASVFVLGGVGLLALG